MFPSTSPRETLRFEGNKIAAVAAVLLLLLGLLDCLSVLSSLSFKSSTASSSGSSKGRTLSSDACNDAKKGSNRSLQSR